MDLESVLVEYAAADTIADEIVSLKHKITELNRKLNSGREALRHLKKLHSNCTTSWVCFGNTFLKLESSGYIEILDKDQKELWSEIERLRCNLKPKVAALHQREGSAEVKGFNLKGMRTEPKDD